MTASRPSPPSPAEPARTLAVAVVGHTNTGKTSLMRTLMRDVDFGEVSDRPAVTRAVEAAVLRAGGQSLVELFDTPGLEDSIGLLEALERHRGDRRIDGIELVREFLETEAARNRFGQESKALRQVLASDIALYVIDTRDRVHGKHRDELTILGFCATPVVPVLNFTADPAAMTAAWREHLARVNMHAVAEFDTVVFDAKDEDRLFEKMRTLLDARGDVLAVLTAEHQAQRRDLIRSSAVLLAELLVDAAAFHVSVPPEKAPAHRDEAIHALKDAVRQREQTCVDQLLVLHRFRRNDVEEEALPIEDGVWGIDLFSPAALKEFGLHAGGAAATGAMVGLTLDVLFAGLALGTATAAGAAIGGLFGAARTHGRRIVDRARGRTELRCDASTLRLLALRQITLTRALLRRGHAALGAIRVGAESANAGAVGPEIMKLLALAQLHPAWSSLETRASLDPTEDATRSDLIDALVPKLQALMSA